MMSCNMDWLVFSLHNHDHIYTVYMINGNEIFTIDKLNAYLERYTTIAERQDGQLNNNSYPTGVVKLVYGYPTFQLTTKAV